MSYSRFGCDGSDVYVYLDVGGYVRCCYCPLYPDGIVAHFDSKTWSGMLAHLEEHMRHGHHVPPHTLAQLRIEGGARGDEVMP